MTRVHHAQAQSSLSRSFSSGRRKASTSLNLQICLKPFRLLRLKSRHPRSLRITTEMSQASRLHFQHHLLELSSSLFHNLHHLLAGAHPPFPITLSRKLLSRPLRTAASRRRFPILPNQKRWVRLFGDRTEFTWNSESNSVNKSDL